MLSCVKELIKIEYEVIYEVDKKFSDFVKGFSVWVYDDVFLFFYLGFFIIFDMIFLKFFRK